MREEPDDSFKLLFEFFMGDLQSIFPQDVVCVRGQDLGQRVLSNLEVNELFESLSALDLEGAV